MDKEEMKQAVKDAFKEYLDEKATAFGWMSIKWLGYSVLAASLVLIVLSYGFKK